MSKLRALLGLTILTVLASPTPWAQPTAAPNDRVNRPGGTTEIAPSPGPATSPALASPALPQAAVQNREQAKAAKIERKVQKKSKPKKKPSKRTNGPRAGNATSSNTPAGVSTAPPK